MIRQKIPIRIKNVENPAGSGTVIHPDPDMGTEASASKLAESTALSGVPPLSYVSVETNQSKRTPTAVTIKERIVVLNVNSNRKSVSHGFLTRIFSTIDRFGVVVDLISTSELVTLLAIRARTRQN